MVSGDLGSVDLGQPLRPSNEKTTCLCSLKRGSDKETYTDTRELIYNMYGRAGYNHLESQSLENHVGSSHPESGSTRLFQLLQFKIC